MPRTVEDAGFRRVAPGHPTCLTTVSLVGLLILGEGDLAFLTCSSFEAVRVGTFVPETLWEGRGHLVVVVLAPPEVLRTGSLNVVEASPGVLRMGMGSFEAYPPGVF